MFLFLPKFLNKFIKLKNLKKRQTENLKTKI